MKFLAIFVQSRPQFYTKKLCTHQKIFGQEIQWQLDSLLAGSAGSHMTMSVIYLHSREQNIMGRYTSDTCTVRWETYYTHRTLAIHYLQICYAMRQRVARPLQPFAATKIRRQTYIDK